jgi:predicted regulator of Ras-like GTPase activity (Roadblock/LC7/MglB family)
VSEQVDRAFKEMLDISTDIDKAILFVGDQVLASNFSEVLGTGMLAKAKELAALGAAKAADMGSAPLTQLVIEAPTGSVFLVREPQDDGWGVLATAKKDSRIGLVFYDMKTCIRDSQEPPEPAFDVAGESAPEAASAETSPTVGDTASEGEEA